MVDDGTGPRPSPYSGRILLDHGGVRIGRLTAVWVDPDTEHAQWGMVQLGMRAGRRTMVPLHQVIEEGDRLRVPYAASLVRTAPAVDAEDELSEAGEATLAQHYRLGLEEEASPVAPAPSAPIPMISEPPLEPAAVEPAAPAAIASTAVALPASPAPPARRRPSPPGRIRRRVRVEPVTAAVAMHCEVLVIDREWILDAEPVSGSVAEEQWEVTLMRQEPVVRTRGAREGQPRSAPGGHPAGRRRTSSHRPQPEPASPSLAADD